MLAPLTQPDDALVLNLPDGANSQVTSRNQTIADYYLSGLSVRAMMIYSTRTDAEQAEVHQTALDFAEPSLRVWVAYDEANSSPKALPRFEAALSEEYVRCETGIFQPTFRFDLYARSAVCCLPGTDSTPLLQFGDGITLTGIAPLPDEASDTLPVIAGWSVADSIPPHVYSVALHVLDNDDALVAQSDYGLLAVAFSCQETLVDIGGLPPGGYRLNVVVYAWESGQRLTGEVAATGEVGESLPLGTFEVIA